MHGIDKAQIRNNSSAKLVFKICDIFANEYRINLAFTACLESRQVDFDL